MGTVIERFTNAATTQREKTKPASCGLAVGAVSVVKPAGDNSDVPRFDGVHQAVFLGDPA